jgi:hypothetical protein
MEETAEQLNGLHCQEFVSIGFEVKEVAMAASGSGFTWQDSVEKRKRCIIQCFLLFGIYLDSDVQQVFPEKRIHGR